MQIGVPRWSVHEFAEGDYCYGIGTLILRVVRVRRDRPVRLHGDLWYLVDGVQVSSTGADLGHREVLIRAARVPEKVADAAA